MRWREKEIIRGRERNCCMRINILLFWNFFLLSPSLNNERQNYIQNKTNFIKKYIYINNKITTNNDFIYENKCKLN